MSAPDLPTRFGFVGLGNMGRPIAVNLAAAGFDLVVHDAAGTAARAPADGTPGVLSVIRTPSTKTIGLRAPYIELLPRIRSLGPVPACPLEYNN